MKNISTFQIVFMAVFIFIAIVGVALFAGFGGTGRAPTPTATIWGTVPSYYIGEVVKQINISSTVINVNYVEKDPDTFESEFVNALAEGSGPDAVLLTDDMLYFQRNKLQPIPYTVFNQRDYLSTFVDGAKIFLSKDGVLGVPLSVDPLVMYFNKNILARNGIARPPRNWQEMVDMGPLVIIKTDTSTIRQALLPFGEYVNIKNAKEILATLFFQTGNKITAQNQLTGQVYSVIDSDLYRGRKGLYGTGEEGAGTETDGTAVGSGSPFGGASAGSNEETQSVVDFYTSFANPSKALYTWNRSLPNSEDMFLSEKLAFYFDYASRIQAIQDKNPNLNFDVAMIPQDPNGVPSVYGKMTAFAIVKNTKNAAGALAVISKLTEKEAIRNWVSIANLPSVRRDLLSEVATSSAYMSVFNRAAVQAETWYDPSPADSDEIFRDMIESITSGREKISNALGDAKNKLDILLKSK